MSASHPSCGLPDAAGWVAAAVAAAVLVAILAGVGFVVFLALDRGVRSPAVPLTGLQERAP